MTGSLTIVGGVYREYCMHPPWREIYGSAGRAATAIARYGVPVDLYSFLDDQSKLVLEERAALEGFSVHATIIPKAVTFSYTHGLAVPSIDVAHNASEPIKVEAEKLIRFGVIEGQAICHAKIAVFDPQSGSNPESYGAGGSTAERLALILNRAEARQLSGMKSESFHEVASKLSAEQAAEVVVIKMGPSGALVFSGGQSEMVPPYKTPRVSKIGTGDVFAAEFGYFWMHENLSAVEAAALASRATAFYCETGGPPTRKKLDAYKPVELITSKRFQSGYKPVVYLAGPFFTLAELWLIEEARNNLQSLGLNVFSPYHDVGRGSAEDVVQRDIDGLELCDVVFAVVDGLDAGTLYEVGYARSIKKPVVAYAENESIEDLKMLVGSGCIVTDDYVSAIYHALWAAAEL
jgi:nucleoside 2-deoxyribosyltransferase